jgi:hypothetical protein
MKKLKELKAVHTSFVESVTALDIKIQQHLKKVKLEYQQNLTDEKVRLLHAVCNGENLDFDKIKTKYLKSKEIAYSLKDDVTKEPEIKEEDLLDKIEQDGVQYYYEPKEKGIVYSMNSKPVGMFKNGRLILI